MENHPPRRARRHGPAPVYSPLHSPTRSDPNDIGDAENKDESDTVATSPRVQPRVVPNGKTQIPNAPALNGLLQVRSGIGAVVQKRRYSLKEALHTESLALKDRHQKIIEEKDRARFVARKCAEKSEEHRKAFEEYEQACAVLAAAKSKSTKSSPTEEPSQKFYMASCESLVKSWTKTVQVKEASLSGWEFKSKRQASVVARLYNEFRAAEASANQSRKKIHENLHELKALDNLLEDL